MAKIEKEAESGYKPQGHLPRDPLCPISQSSTTFQKQRHRLGTSIQTEPVGDNSHASRNSELLFLVPLPIRREGASLIRVDK